MKPEQIFLVQTSFAKILPLAQGLDDDFTPEVAAAWTALYDLLASVMQAAALKIEKQGVIK